ncbi:MAG: nucleotidyltransferase domain-containing protein [Oscillospiraceae bacterium]|nr:nucleotidyltransferase domain-containing protein [Oscillospiraceae bacterium]
MCTADAVKILGEVYQKCSTVFPAPIMDAYLYGSYARGDYHEESDIDILLLVDLDWPEITSRRRAISHIVSDLCLNYDITISVTAVPFKLFTQYADDLPFYHNVLTEGIRYVA